MTLPVIDLPTLALPFDVPLLWHPVAVHFLVVLPIIILLLELMNLIMKKKAVGGVSFFLMILTVAFAATAYITGLTDGKEAYPALEEVAKTALGEHKLLGIYLMLGSALLLLLKLLAMTGNKILRGIYLFLLIAFVVVMFKQGKEGGDLVYVHGLNVKQVATIESKMMDIEEELEDAKEALTASEKKMSALQVDQNTSCNVVAKTENDDNVSVVPQENKSTPLPTFTPSSETETEKHTTASNPVVEEAKASPIVESNTSSVGTLSPTAIEGNVSQAVETQGNVL